MNLSSIREAPPSPKDLLRDAGLLLLRATIGGTLLLAHGMPKLLGWGEKSASFPDPLGIGNTASLALAVFGEVFCAAAVLFGLATRAAAGVVFITMLVAFAVVHSGDPFQKRELAMMYGAPCVVLILTGAGRFSLDQLLFGGRARGSLKLDV
jgi:putative oxidoreductase